MRRSLVAILSALLFCSGLSGGLAAQIATTSVLVRDARSMGMGGTFRVFATGYSTFFGNPAGFAGPASLTLGDLATWAYLKPYPVNLSALAAIAQGQVSQSQFEESVDALMAEDGGIGGGATLGCGWAGKGFGLGLTLISDAASTDASYAGSLLQVKTQANAILGAAWPLHIGAFDLRFGLDLRAFYRLDSLGDWPFDRLASALYSGNGFYETISSLKVRGGYGLAVDSGATLAWGPLSFGVMIRDYGYKFSMSDSSVKAIVEDLDIPMYGDIGYVLTPQYTAGLSLVLGQGGPLVASLYAEADDPMSVLEEAGKDLESALALLHAGFELRILKFLSLRGGANQGLIALGFGLDFSLLEVDAALFTEQLSSGSSRTGFCLQTALRI